MMRISAFVGGSIIERNQKTGAIPTELVVGYFLMRNASLTYYSCIDTVCAVHKRNSLSLHLDT